MQTTEPSKTGMSLSKGMKMLYVLLCLTALSSMSLMVYQLKFNYEKVFVQSDNYRPIEVRKPEQSVSSHINQQRVMKTTELIDTLPSNASFEEVLKTAAINNTLVISLLDKAYIKFALNFFTSSSRYINHSYYHLILCLDEEAVVAMKKHSIFCYRYKNSHYNSADNSLGDFGSSAYYLKTNIKTALMLEILTLNYMVLFVDFDIVLFQDPMPYLRCDDCDIIYQRDRVQINTGFIYVKPTELSKLLYKTAYEQYEKYQSSHDQTYFNMAVDILKRNFKTPIRGIELPTTKFMCGVYYFENSRRFFGDKPCPACVMVHNNYIGSLAAKEYRFKENHLWTLDENGYYSNPHTKYLTYDNPSYFGHKTDIYEKNALLTAMLIGRATNRIVILPKFSCCDCTKKFCDKAHHKCPLLHLLRMSSFDSVYRDFYREHSFLSHPLVPNSIKKSKPKLLKISLDGRPEFHYANESRLYEEYVPVYENEKDKVYNIEHFGNWTKQFATYPIIHFKDLYHVHTFTSYINEIPVAFQEDTHKVIFTCSTQSQWENQEDEGNWHI